MGWGGYSRNESGSHFKHYLLASTHHVDAKCRFTAVQWLGYMKPCCGCRGEVRFLNTRETKVLSISLGERADQQLSRMPFSISLVYSGPVPSVHMISISGVQHNWRLNTLVAVTAGYGKFYGQIFVIVNNFKLYNNFTIILYDCKLGKSTSAFKISVCAK